MTTLILNPIKNKPTCKFSEDVIYKYMRENYGYYYDSGTKLIDVQNLAEATALYLDDYDENLMIHEIYFRIAVKVAQEIEHEQELELEVSNVWSEFLNQLEKYEKEQTATE